MEPRDNVIRIQLNGTPNTMALLYESTLYIVYNANSLAEAQAEIAKSEGVHPNELGVFNARIYAYQLKSNKYKFLKQRGYRKISAAPIGLLDELIVQHFGVEGEIQ